MGNIVLVKKVLSGNICPSSKKFDLEDLIKNEIVRAVYRKFASETGQYHDENCSLTDIFDDFEKQQNDNDDENWKKNLIKELNELHTAGLSTPDFFTQDLKETRFEKYFRVVVKGLNEGEDYYRNQYCKFFLLYSYIRPYFSEEGKKKDDFYKNLAEQLESTDTEKSGMQTNELGISLTFTLLDELFNFSPNILENALKNIYSVMIQLKSGLLNTFEYQFYEREQVLNRHRDYLLKLIKSKHKISSTIKELALRILLIIGNIRESGEDYLIIYNLIREYDLRVSLDTELHLNKYFQETAVTTSDESSAPKFRLVENESKEVEFMTGLGNDPSIYNQTDFAFDEKYVYLWNYGQGLFKFGWRNTVTSKKGLNYKYASTSSSYTNKKICLIKDKLIVRDYNETDVPFRVYDKNTLEVVETDDYKSKLIKCKRNLGSDTWNTPKLETTNSSDLSAAISKGGEESYRSLTETPLFTDGKHIYVISTFFVEGNYDKEEVGYQVEAFCPETWRCVKTTKLVVEPDQSPSLSSEAAAKIVEETEKVKHSLTRNNIIRCNCATNGKVMTLSHNGLMYFFDLETGKRSSETVSISSYDGGYDYNTNTFWSYNSGASSPTINSFKVEGFKNETQGESSSSLNDFIKSRTTQIVEQQRNEQRIQPRSIVSMLKGLGSLKENEVSIPESRTNSQIALSLYLIMYSIGRGCDDMDKVMQKWMGDIMEKSEKIRIQASLFRSKFAVSVSAKFITELSTALESFSDFAEGNMTDDNILDQYQFMWIIKLIHRLMQSLEKLNLSLSEVVLDEQACSRFVDLISYVVSKITNPGLAHSQYQAYEFKNESEAIWRECILECRGIQNLLLNITSDSGSDVSDKIAQLADALKNNTITASQEIFLKYLSQSDSLTSILQENSQDVIFEALCDRKTDKLVSHIDSLTLSSSYGQIEYTDLELISDDFVYSFVNRTLISVFSIQSSISKALDNDQKKKVELLREQATNNMKYFTKVFSKLTSCTLTIFAAATKATKRVLEEAVPLHTEETKDKDKATFKTKENYIEFQNHLNDVVKMHNKFIDFIHIYVASLASEKKHKMTRHLNNMCRKSIDLLHEISQFCHEDAEAERSVLKIELSECTLRHNLSQDFMKFMIWSLSKIAHSFIKIIEVEKKDEDSKANQNLLRSKLLSGGVENRFLNCFSKDTCKTIENLAEITGDKKLLQYLAKVDLLEEDEFLQAIIREGMNPSIDKLLNLLQWNLLKKNPAAKAGDKIGMTLARCAFASLLSFNKNDDSCSYSNIASIIDQLEMTLETIDEDMNENQKNKQLLEDIKELGDLNPILERWESASKMRVWLQEKRKDISNSIKHKVEQEFKKKEEDEKALEETKEKTAQDIEIDTKEGNDEETIDTASKGKPSNAAIQDEIFKREDEQIKQLVKKVIEKSELLIKLATPESWDRSDNSDKNLRKKGADEENEVDNREESIVTKLTKIKTIQASEGTVTSFENLSNKSIFTSCASSVLACLQCSISAKQIMSAIEEKYINAMNRYCGLKIMGDISSCYMSDDTKISCFNWFCGSLRKNTNILAHYSDELVGMGDYLLDKCRVAFFDVYNGIVKQIKETSSKDTIEFLLNCIKWRISATDHQYILKSGIIQTLKEGNGQQNRDKNPIKYSWGHKIEFKTYDGDYSLSHLVVESLEFIMMACFSRILSESDDKNLSMKKTGSQIDKIQQAFSVVNTNITEVLLGTSFEALFEQIARYNRYIEHFDPIDWKLFVTHRNKLRFTNQSLSIDNTLPFEDEKTEEEKQREAEEEKKREDEEEAKIVQEAEEGNARDKVELAIEKQTNKELKKLNSIYDEKIILKLLRLIEMFTSIALKNSHIHQFVLKVTRPVQIKTLVHLLINCQSKHGIMTLKILTNLLKIGIDKNTLDNSFIELKEMEVVREIFELNTKVKFEECAFIQFCYNYLLKIRSSQWDKRAIESNGAYIISCSVVRLLRTILVTTYQPKWKAKIEEAMDAFIADIDSYPIEEFDVMLSLFEGGEYNGLNTGAYGKTAEGNKFITAGFVKNWYDLSTPDGSGSSSNFEIKDVTADIKTKDDYLLAIYFDENNPQRNDMFLAVPDQVNPISYLTNESDKYLLNKDRLSNFLKAMELDKVPDKNSIESLSKRCVGIKILINQIEIHGDEIAKLLDDSFRDSFINFLLTECTNKDEKKDSIKYEWYDQKLYALKKYATENQVGMNASNDNSVIFNGKLMSVSTIIRDTHESYYECFPLTSVMNYGCITQKKTYNLIDSASVGITRYRNDNAVILKSSEVDTAEKILEIFKHVEVLITSDLDLKDIHDKIKQLGDNTTTYFRSIIVIGHREFESLLCLVSEGPKVKVPETSSLNSHDAFCKELEVFCNYQRETLDEIFVGKETANLPEKIKLLVQHSSKAEKKEEEKKEEKKKEDESFNSVTDGISKLINHENLRTNLNELANFQNSNYTSSSNEVKDQKGDLFTKIYNINSNEVMGNYKSSLVGLYQQSCKKTLSSFFDRISIDKLIDITLVSEESTEKLIQYIQLRGNDAVTLFKQTNNRIVYDNFLKLFKKIIEICSNNEKYNKVLDVIFKKSILLGTCNALKQANKNKNKYIKDTFNSEESALMSLNTFLIPDALKYILQERPVLIYDPAEFSNLMSVLLMIPITFREEKEFHKRIYMTLYKLILPFVQKPKDYNNLDIIKSILTHPFLKDLFDKIPKQTNSTSDNFTNEQKILFEIYLLVHLLEDSNPEITSIYSYPDQLLDIEKSKIILKEMKKFDFISYLVYFENDLTEEERKTTMSIETLHNRYKPKFTAKFSYSGFKKMKVKIHDDTKLDGMSGIAFSSDPQGISVTKKISSVNIDKGEKEFDFAGKTMYIHYPYNPPRVVCFGYGYDYRLGNNESYNTTTNPIEMKDFTIPLAKLRSRSGYSIGLGKDGKIFWTGYRSDWGGYKYTMSKYDFTMPEEKIIDMNCGSYNCVVLTENHKLYIQGYDTGFHLDNNCTKSYFWHKERPNEEEEKIIAYDVGYNYHVYVTDNGKAYGAGNDFMRGINLECVDKKYIQIPFEEGVIPKRPVCTNNSETNKPLLMFVDNKGRSELWSGGYSSYGLLGQGDGKNESRSFAPLNYDKENITFTKAIIKYYFGLAVTSKGELYGWGQNSYKQLAMSDTKTYFTPTEIQFFKDYYVHDFECGDYHALIVASPRNDMEKRQMFATGDIRGISDQSAKTNDGVLHLKQFDNCNYTFLECGENTFYIGFEGENKASEGVNVHEGYTCEVTNETPIQGTMHFWKSKNDGNWHFVSQQGYNKLKEDKSLPGVCYATKSYIKNIQEKEWPEIDENELLKAEDDNSYPKYVAHNSQAENKILPIPKSTETDIFEAESHDVNPLIFYRLARPLKEEAKLSTLNLTNYFEESEYHGLKIEIAPDYTYEKNKDIIKLQQDKYNKTEASIRKFDEKYDGELIESIENYITSTNIDLLNNPNTQIQASDLTFTSKDLKTMTAKDVQPRINAFLSFNQSFLKVLPYIILDDEMIREVTEGKAEVQADTLSVLFMISKALAFKSIKYAYIKRIGDSLPTSYNEPDVMINRRLIQFKRDKGKIDHKGEWSMFSTVMKKLKESNYESLRKANSSNKAWRSCFMGEGSYDAGGPYRESLSNITIELQSTTLPLLIPTQNQKNDHGLHRDCWTVNPSSNSPNHMEMYKFLGGLIGMAFRAGHVIDIKLPPMFWKRFIGDPITLDDLSGSDAYAVQAIKDLEKNKDQIPEDMFEDTMNLTFTTQLSNGETVPICEGGESRKVGYNDIEEYHKLVLKTRSDEAAKQIEKMREGFELVFPMSILGILNWKDIEERVRGPNEISVEVLKSITCYSCCSSTDEFVERFWRVFSEFTNDERSKFLKFVWGRSRLPPQERLRDQSFTIYLMDSYRFSDHNKQFPCAHTCGFTLDLPRYTTDEACKSKILYAITMCGEIDTDGSYYTTGLEEGYNSD